MRNPVANSHTSMWSPILEKNHICLDFLFVQMCKIYKQLMPEKISRVHKCPVTSQFRLCLQNLKWQSKPAHVPRRPCWNHSLWHHNNLDSVYFCIWACLLHAYMLTFTFLVLFSWSWRENNFLEEGSVEGGCTGRASLKGFQLCALLHNALR